MISLIYEEANTQLYHLGLSFLGIRKRNEVLVSQHVVF